MAAPPNPFSKATFAFLHDLARNNRKDWFDPRKDRYEKDVREPALAFIDGMAGEIGKVSPHLRAEARKVGGSLMRVYRD
ncbi:MAG: DUF2461 family protein, partial [Planctomycetota bacterium]|nr:DUF2461 family protein [Planctomycetota bacterium]